MLFFPLGGMFKLRSETFSWKKLSLNKETFLNRLLDERGKLVPSNYS